MLAKEVCEARFEFWLQNNDFSQVNDGILLDVMGEQLGHSHYATTRLSYLHGVEWLPEFFTPKREYSVKQLHTLIGEYKTNFLMSMPSIAKRPPANTALNSKTTVTLSDAELTEELLTTSIGSAVTHRDVPACLQLPHLMATDFLMFG
ncbi:orphan protein [Vibrio sp. JCM 19236]|nr:orphan protein [Vibrio sp. JCM 19236]